MPNLKTEMKFTCTLTQKEFSVMTRCLAGHELREGEEKLAAELNVRLLELRAAQIRGHLELARRALETAEMESKQLLGT